MMMMIIIIIIIVKRVGTPLRPPGKREEDHLLVPLR